MNWIWRLGIAFLALLVIAGLSACEGEERDAPLDTGPEVVEPGGPDEESLLSAGGDRLGIEGVNVTPSIAEALALPQDQNGVLVTRVVPASPAAEAGLRAGDQATTVDGKQILLGGDVIVGFAGQHVDNLQDLDGYLLVAAPDERHAVIVLRDGEVTEVEVELGDLPQVDEP